MDTRHSDSRAVDAADENWMRRPQVLVVDDVREIRDFLVRFLTRFGFRALAAENGLVAQALLKKETPALVISDLSMPVCDGWDLLTWCHEQLPTMPVLIISGKGLGERPAIERWAAAAFPKPFDIDQLLAAVQRLAPAA